jgi:hypothetical protein
MRLQVKRESRRRFRSRGGRVHGCGGLLEVVLLVLDQYVCTGPAKKFAVIIPCEK